MTTRAIALGALALGLCAAFPAHAADDDLAQIRREMKSLRGDYEHKIRELERRLKKAEERAEKAEAAAAAAPAPVPAAAPEPPPPPAPAPVASQSAFNPSISVILNGSFNHSENDPGAARIPGFILDEEAGLPDRGFSLDESEVTLSANVDHAFFASLTIALESEGEVAVEEAFVQTTSLPWGLTAKAGRFFSGIGYLNERHAHTWDFVDQPLPYRAFLGGQYGDDGIEVRWLAPTDFFLEFGAEWYRGDAFPSGNADDNGTGTFAAFAKTGGDLDEESSWLAGLSYLKAKADQRDVDGDVFSGDSHVAIANVVYKWAPNGNARINNLIVNAEYFFNREDGTFNGVPVDLDRQGWYVQGVYQFMPQWRAGLRYAGLASEGASGPLAGSSLDDFGHAPQTWSALLEYDTSEFGRLRLQYSYDDSDLSPNNTIQAAYTMAIGAHGAHKF